eukprot:TRINITY_DN10636_c0_g1_i1.p1 TRINITY_DN10636_c0_g1~~TRINITY_DN10636_c0_g1_i1.p1  ORF type:complete len:383 (+),score=77.45 TRINITY_DN10636_c0_g1_i1:61-1209(+)
METPDLSEYLPAQVKKLSEETKTKIQQFRSHPSVKPHLTAKHHDFYISRWLTARKNDVDKAVEMWVNHMEWRNKVQADNSLEKFPSHEMYQKLIKYWPSSLHTMSPYTYDGSYVLYEAYGRIDPKIVDLIGMDTFMQFHVFGMEKLSKIYFDMTEKYGYYPGTVVITDLGDVGWNTLSKTVMKLLQEILTTNQNNYPDTLRKMYIVNCPRVVLMAWKVIKLWIDPRTLAKFEFVNGNEDSFRELFTKIIPAKDLPKRLGGTSNDDIPVGGPMTSHDESQGFVTLDVGRGSSQEIEVEAVEGDVLSWKFRTVDYDISFGINLKQGSSKSEVVAVSRVQSQDNAEQGMLVVEKAGTYVFLFDNSYSWTRGKTVKYIIDKNSQPV